MGMLAKIRRMHLRDGKSIREISRVTGLSRNTVRGWLRQQDVTGSTLDNSNDGRLGWDTFLCSRPAQQDRSDAQYTLAPLH